MKKFLIIQTAFIGDVILATPVVEKLKHYFPEAKIDFLLRKGNEDLLKDHPGISNLLIWNKKEKKYSNLRKIIGQVRKNRYDCVLNLQRFASTGLVTFLSDSKMKAGFDKNPFSFCYQIKAKHEIGNEKHETERNLELIASFTGEKHFAPKLYPSAADREKTKPLKNQPYICIAPASVWFTKQLPQEKWLELIEAKKELQIYLIGGPGDEAVCDQIIQNSNHDKINNLAGKLSFLESASLMRNAIMNYVNDSAPLHIASAMNAPVTAFFCSTVPEFGFGPVSDIHKTVQTEIPLSCRPCGLHGKKECPEGHFNCAKNIEMTGL